MQANNDKSSAPIDPNDETSSAPIDPPPNYVDIAKKERARVEELIQSKGTQYGSYPRFNVAVRGQKVSAMIPLFLFL